MGKYIALALIGIILLFPVYFMAEGSFQEVRGFYKMPPDLWPPNPTLVNYQTIVDLGFSGRWLINTALVVASIVALGVVTNGAAGYAFAFGKFVGKDAIFWVIIAALFVSRSSLLISMFVIVRKLGLHDLGAVIAMGVFWPAGVFLFRNYFMGIPKSYLESARMDGAHEWTILFRVILPIAKPMIGLATVFMGIAAMQDYIWQMLMLQDNSTKTLLVGLISSIYQTGGAGSHSIKNIGYDLACGTILFIPLVSVFAFSSRYFVEGLQGGEKG